MAIDRKKLLEYRGTVIEKSVNIETILSALISLHYFKCLLTNFVLEVLYDEYFSFALKRRIIEKVIPNLDKHMIDDLNRLSTIRNYFAHCGIEFVRKEERDVGGRIYDPRDIKKEIDFEALFKEFIEKEPKVTKYFFDIYREMGGEG